MSMDNNKNISMKNNIKLLIFVAGIGAVCSLVLWLFLLAVDKGTELLWEILPQKFDEFSAYPLVVCLVGGILIGLFRKKYGDYPQGMMEVFGTLKQTKTYPYEKIIVLLIAAFLPLIIGSSVGPEAGMVGVITALCCWAGTNLRFAKKESAYYSEIGSAVTLSILFHAPLFGLLHMEEENTEQEREQELSKKDLITVYVLATAIGLGVFKLLNAMVCNVSMGFPSLDIALPQGYDYLVMFLYIIVGILLALLFEASEKAFGTISKKLPPVLGESLAGMILGITVMFFPMIQFSGEHQMGVLINDYAMYSAIGMIGIAILKIIITSMCIELGLKGGHFFPLIFASVCMGYGIALCIWPGVASHAIFAAAITTAATLGFSMKKPLAVTMLLFLCFPVRMVFWIVFAAAIASYIAGWKSSEKGR